MIEHLQLDLIRSKTDINCQIKPEKDMKPAGLNVSV